MSIVIFGDTISFPEGNAATNRVHTYAKGFTENNINVHVICFASNYLDNPVGIINKINYYHPFGQTKRNNYFLIRRWLKFTKYIKTVFLFREISKNDKITAINVWSESLLVHIFIYLLSKSFKTKIILERSENPLRHCKDNFIDQRFGQLKMTIEKVLYDGFFCISRYIVDFYEKKGVDHKKILLVPSTVDPDRFIIKGEKPLQYNYIGYFGALTFERDNVDLLIKAFGKIIAMHSDVHLVLGGFSSEGSRNQIISLIEELNIGNKVHLLEYLSRAEITNYIVHSDILIMVRKNDMQAQASYPSKLTEYLATSIPVVTVNVGEIKDYLSDGINVFMVEPEDCDALAEKIDYVLNNYEYAQKVAQKGKELTGTIFNYNFQAKRMIGFINELNNH